MRFAIAAFLILVPGGAATAAESHMKSWLGTYDSATSQIAWASGATLSGPAAERATTAQLALAVEWCEGPGGEPAPTHVVWFVQVFQTGAAPVSGISLADSSTAPSAMSFAADYPVFASEGAQIRIRPEVYDGVTTAVLDSTTQLAEWSQPYSASLGSTPPRDPWDSFASCWSLSGVSFATWTSSYATRSGSVELFSPLRLAEAALRLQATSPAIARDYIQSAAFQQSLERANAAVATYVTVQPVGVHKSPAGTVLGVSVADPIVMELLLPEGTTGGNLIKDRSGLIWRTAEWTLISATLGIDDVTATFQIPAGTITVPTYPLYPYSPLRVAFHPANTMQLLDITKVIPQTPPPHLEWFDVIAPVPGFIALPAFPPL